jgi:hypothetical protein
MAQSYPLDNIIKSVDKKKFLSSAPEQRCIIECKSGKAKDRAGRFENVDYFLVTHSVTVKHTGSSIHIEDDTGRYIDICPSYRVSCPPGNQTRVAENLYSEASGPAVVLDRIIESWIIKAAGANVADFIDTYLAQRASLQAQIVDDARAHIGLDLKGIELALDDEEAALKTLRLEFKSLLVGVSDFEEEQSLNFIGDLRVDERNKINAIATHKQRWKLNDRIQEEILEFFSEKVELEQLYGDLVIVRDDLKRYLNERLKWAGRQFGNVFLKRAVLEEIPPFIKKAIPVRLEVPEYPDEIKIDNRIEMVRKDAAKFKANKPESLEDWITEQVEQVVSSVFFGKTYVDILLKREQLQDEIKIELNRRAAAIGYTIRQLITIPDLEPITWLDKIEFEVDDEYTTRASQKVRLKVSVKAKLSSLRDVESYLNRRQSVPAAMKEDCYSDLRQFIHEIDSENFYAFEYPVGKEDSVRTQIIELIRTMLVHRFNADVISIAPEMGETDITVRERTLKRQWQDFVAVVETRRDLGQVTVTGKFRVTGIDPGYWIVFESQDFGIEEVRKHIEDTISAAFSMASPTTVNFTDEMSKSGLEEALNRICGDSVSRAYGVRIALENVDRRGTELEVMLSQKLISLKKEYIESLARGDDPEDTEAIQARIEALQTRGNQLRLSPGEQPTVERALLPETSKGPQ